MKTIKKILLSIVVLFSAYSFSQETENTTDFNRNELKGNALLLVLGSFDVSYERI
jgi:hypothetical protein